MTDPELIAKRLAFIETRLRELTTMARLDRVHHDLKEERFVEHTPQLAIQAALDVASHVVSDERLGEPATNRELFDRLASGRWLSKELVSRLGGHGGVPQRARSWVPGRRSGHRGGRRGESVG